MKNPRIYIKRRRRRLRDITSFGSRLISEYV